MSLNAAAVQLLVDKGLSAQDIADVMAAAERKKDNTAAERQARYRAKKKAPASRRNSNAVSPPIDNIHTPREISSDDESLSPASDVEQVLDRWRVVAKPLGLPCWDKITPKRQKAVRCRLADHGFEAIVQAIEHVPKSGFLRGERGDWGGANLDFLMRPDAVPNILEGKYDDRTKTNDHRQGNSNRNTFDLAMQKLGRAANG